MFRCQCHGCCHAAPRRRFLQGCGAAAVAASASLVPFQGAKLFDQWDQFGWHRVTVYGDVKEPLAEFGRALGLEVIEEA